MTEVEKLEAQAKKLAEKLAEAKRNLQYECPDCKAKTSIKDLTLQKEIFYVEPYGCTAGDYWTEGSSPEFAIVCPCCSKRTTYHEYKDHGWDIDQNKKRYEALGVTKLLDENRYYFKKRTEYYTEYGQTVYCKEKEQDDLY